MALPRGWRLQVYSKGLLFYLQSHNYSPRALLLPYLKVYISFVLPTLNIVSLTYFWGVIDLELPLGYICAIVVDERFFSDSNFCLKPQLEEKRQLRNLGRFVKICAGVSKKDFSREVFLLEDNFDTTMTLINADMVQSAKSKLYKKCFYPKKSYILKKREQYQRQFCSKIKQSQSGLFRHDIQAT